MRPPPRRLLWCLRCRRQQTDALARPRLAPPLPSCAPACGPCPATPSPALCGGHPIPRVPSPPPTQESKTLPPTAYGLPATLAPPEPAAPPRPHDLPLR
ncbi:hypothetical protein U9M48_034617 [Paspalum notatum var. saurae]|uniref:Uncharacterized protein n=1 Tax=Paspalum notatum var. saurae TaxID=547442 RepID=A0AAQ3X6X0_PASNO